MDVELFRVGAGADNDGDQGLAHAANNNDK